jgi:hypothetical protein
LRRAASCDQANLRSSNINFFQVSMAMINVNVIGDLPNLRTQFRDVFHRFFPLRSLRSLRFILLYRRQPRTRRRFQIRGERSRNGQQIYARPDIFAIKAQRNRLSEDFCHAPAANSPPKKSHSPLERFQVFHLLLFEVQIKQRTHSHFNRNYTAYARLKRS